MVCTRCYVALAPNSRQCANCGNWITSHKEGAVCPIIPLSEAGNAEEKRLLTGPWDKAFGGGIVTTSIVLLGGKAGAGKSTLSLQLSDAIADIDGADVLYVAAEENPGQIRARAERLGIKHPDRIHVAAVLGSRANLEGILDWGVKGRNITIVVLDSLPGFIGVDNIGQALEVCSTLKTFAERRKIPSILIDHINKAGDFAGLEALQHAVDATLLFETDEGGDLRTLRARKNRHGPAGVDSLVVFEMGAKGLSVVDRPETSNG